MEGLMMMVKVECVTVLWDSHAVRKTALLGD